MDALFEKNNHANAFPIRAVFMETGEDLLFPMQAMFVAPKRNFKKAHDRNKLKRRMREAYRLHKQAFYSTLQAKDKKIIVAFIYTAKKQENYAVIEAAVLKLLEQVVSGRKKA